MMAKVRLWHIGDRRDQRSPNHEGIISVASMVDFDQRTVSIGVGFCSPDDHFLRFKSKSIPMGRLAKHPIILKFTDNPAVAIKRFLIDMFKEGSAIYDPKLPNRELRDRLEMFYRGGVTLKADYVVQAPYKAVKHFPFAFEWPKHIVFPAAWYEQIEASLAGIARAAVAT